MRECVCVQCSEHELGYAPEYFQCECCDRWGTEDEFPADDMGGATCLECLERETEYT